MLSICRCLKKISRHLILLLIFTSCGNTFKIDGFNSEKWIKSPAYCNNYRSEKAALLIENEELLLSSTQNEIESLLGKANEHELYNRNQKFFHYRISPPDSCASIANPEYLSVRFNAIGRASEFQIIIREN